MALVNQSGIVIPAGESESNYFNGGGDDLVRIFMPSDWTDARLTFLVSPDGSAPFVPLTDVMAGEVTLTVKPNTALFIPGDWSHYLGYVRLRSGTAEQPVIQAADRNFSIDLETARA